MFSALPLTFCPLPPITHSRAKAADLGNGLPPSSPASDLADADSDADADASDLADADVCYEIGT